MVGKKATSASSRLTTEGECTTGASLITQVPPGVTQWTNQPEQRMECRGDIAVGIHVPEVRYLTV